MAHPTITRQYTGQTSPCPSGTGRWFFDFDHSARKFRIGFDSEINEYRSDWCSNFSVAVLNMGGGAAADQLFFGKVPLGANRAYGFPLMSIFTITELPS